MLGLEKWKRMSVELLQPDESAERLMKAARETIAAGEFGSILAQTAQKMPVLAYGSKALCESHPQSFTDGSAIFVSNAAVSEAAQDPRSLEGASVAPILLMHEMRACLNHPNRLKAFPEELAQVAGETSAYCKLKMGFPDMKWPSSLEDRIAASALPAMDMERYSGMAEEAIAREIWARCPGADPSKDTEISDESLRAGLAASGLSPTLCTMRAVRSDPVREAIALDEHRQFESELRPDSLLHIAAERGEAGACEALMPVCDPLGRDANGRTPLMRAAAAGQIQCVPVLAKAGGLNMVDLDGRSAAKIAESSGFEAMAKEIEREAASTMSTRAAEPARQRGRSL